MTNQNTFIADIIRLLDAARIPYMISGSTASAFYGNPRATNDTDIVIDPTRQSLLDFLQSLETRYYASREAAIEALNQWTMFNVIDIKYGWKADLILRKTRTYSQQEFARRRKTMLNGLELYLLSPEDSILSKLEWANDRQSKLHRDDILGVLVSQWDTLDFDYLRTWAHQLQVFDTLEQFILEAKKQNPSD
jgi:hypothetical protein